MTDTTTPTHAGCGVPAPSGHRRVRSSAWTDGLAAAVWTSDLQLAHRLRRRVRAGMARVNTFDAADDTVPVGGFKQSGSGRDKSLHALDGHTQPRTTWMDLA